MRFRGGKILRWWGGGGGSDNNTSFDTHLETHGTVLLLYYLIVKAWGTVIVKLLTKLKKKLTNRIARQT